MTKPSDDQLIPVESLDDIPTFANEDEEADFWSTHSFGEALLEQMGPLDDVLPPPRTRRRRRVVTNASEFLREIPFQPILPARAPRPQIIIGECAWLRAS